MTDSRLSPGEIRAMLAEADIDITASSWPEPGFVIANGETLSPCLLRGIVFVNSLPRYSAAWL